jgi:hypothetical protein
MYASQASTMLTGFVGASFVGAVAARRVCRTIWSALAFFGFQWLRAQTSPWTAGLHFAHGVGNTGSWYFVFSSRLDYPGVPKPGRDNGGGSAGEMGVGLVRPDQSGRHSSACRWPAASSASSIR